MSTRCCETVPHPHSSFEGLAKATHVWQERLQAGLGRVINANEQNMGHLEEEILQKTKELGRAVPYGVYDLAADAVERHPDLDAR